LVFSQSHHGPYSFSLNRFAAGIYQVKITTPEVIKTERILIY
jgi:hypothetical protein